MIRHKIYRLLIEHMLLQLLIALFFFFLFFLSSILISPFGFGSDYDQVELNGSGQAISDDSITNLMKGINAKVDSKFALIDFHNKSKLIQEKKGYIIKSMSSKKINRKINQDYPILMENGTCFYLFHSHFTLIMDDFHIVTSSPDTFIKDGKLFNAQKLREGKNSIILLQLPNGYYMNNQPIKIRNGDSKETIEVNSIIQFNDKEVTYCNLNDSKILLKHIQITDPMSQIYFQTMDLTYDALYDKLAFAGKGFSATQMDKITIASELYQYFVGYRYDYIGKKGFYRTKSGYFMEQEEERFFLENAPLYFTEEKKLLLPCDYVLIQPNKFLMNKISAMTELSYQKGIVFTSFGDTAKTYRDIILFDGKDTYLFFNNVELNWGDVTITISPLSSVIVNDATLEVYDYKKDKYMTYYLDGYQEVIAIISKNIKLNLNQDILYRPDGQEQILFSDPSLLKNAE